MRKILPLLLLAVMLSLAACSADSKSAGEQQNAGDSSSGDESAFENPFAGEGLDSHSSLGHGMPVTDPEKRPEIEYTGGECSVNYSISASGIGRSFGFLLYVNGIPQPYKLNPESEYAYLHPVSLAKDVQDMPFTFLFTPVTGSQGTPATLTVTSLTNPQFQPDMEKTSSYGGYHSELTAEYQINFAADPPAFPETAAVNNCISNMSRQTEPITSDYLEIRGFSLEGLNENMFNFITYNGEIKYDNMALHDGKPVTIHYELAGIPGLRSQTTFYIDHTPIATEDGALVFENTFTSGETIVYDFEIDPAKLGNFNTFYAITVPLNVSDFPDYPLSPLKTNSILFYQ